MSAQHRTLAGMVSHSQVRSSYVDSFTYVVASIVAVAAQNGVTPQGTATFQGLTEWGHEHPSALRWQLELM